MNDHKPATHAPTTHAKAEDRPSHPAHEPKTAKVDGSLDLGYALLAEPDFQPDPDATDKANAKALADHQADKKKRAHVAIAAAQAWELPIPHPQDHRYTLPARQELLTQLGILLASLPEGDKA